MLCLVQISLYFILLKWVAYMKLIVLGDKTNHGGSVMMASSTLLIEGVAAALVGDLVSCPIIGHGITPILEGASTFFSDGKQVAIEGSKCGCGCTLIASQTVFIAE